MGFTISPSTLIVNAVTSLVNSAIIVGMPVTGSPVPLFALCEIPDETIHGAVTLPGALTQAGEMKTRAVIQPSVVELNLAFAEHDGKNSDIFRAVQVALTAVAELINSFASYGAILPNLSGLTTGYVQSQISSLFSIKNNMMPVMVLANYFSLGVLTQNTPYLASQWFIEDIMSTHEDARDGVMLKVTLREQFTPIDTTTLKGAIKAFASEIVSPLAGTSVGSLF